MHLVVVLVALATLCLLSLSFYLFRKSFISVRHFYCELASKTSQDPQLFSNLLVLFHLRRFDSCLSEHRHMVTTSSTVCLELFVHFLHTVPEPFNNRRVIYLIPSYISWTLPSARVPGIVLEPCIHDNLLSTLRPLNPLVSLLVRLPQFKCSHHRSNVSSPTFAFRSPITEVTSSALQLLLTLFTCPYKSSISLTLLSE